MLRNILLAATILLMSSAAWADDESAFRFGVMGGSVTIEADDVDLKGDSFGWGVFAGYELNRYFAVEVGYMDGGEAKDTITEGVTVSADTTAITGSLIGSIPISDAFSLYGRAGYMHWESAQALRVDGETVLAGDFDGNDPYFGAGVAIGVEESLLRIEYSVASLDDSDISVLSAQIVWRF